MLCHTCRVHPEIDVDLPVRHVLPAVTAALRRRGAAVLVAPPGTGKTSLAPLAVAEWVTGRVVVAQPRRVAARAAAHRMAALLGERTGERIGYAVRGDRRTGPRTRVEVVTTGLLVQRLQRDPELAGVGAVLLDECHERHLDSDLALAFTVEARAALRPDLRLLAMSATVEADRFAALLGDEEGPAPVVAAESALHPVGVSWAPPARPVPPPNGPRVDPRLLDHVADTVRRAVSERDGDLLVFLPGAGEIAAVAGRLADLRARIDLLPLHGRQPGREQDAALRPGPRRRVVLATAVAESSLTVPGVRVVVDAGLSRVPRLDLARGLGSLATVPVSRAAAAQRAGRAGREAPGWVYRCWAEATHERLPAYPEPEIAGADLTSFALQLACWGSADGAGLALPEPPPDAALRVARTTLTALGALDPAGRVTGRGRAIARIGTHPRLARALLDGLAPLGVDRAAEVVALLAEESIGRDDDLVAGWRRLRAGVDPAATARWRTEVRRLRDAVDRRPAPDRAGTPAGTDPAPGHPPGPATDRPALDGPATDHPTPDGTEPGAPVPDDLAAGLLVGLAYPERLARLRQPGAGSYLMAGGTAADLSSGSPLFDSPGWPWPGRTGHPAAARPGSGWPRSSTRRPPAPPADRCCGGSGRSTGPTVTCWPATSSGSARSC
ncbi:hypothetical protein GCM10027605_25630 [Micromonospora zhanjiangensis]